MGLLHPQHPQQPHYLKRFKQFSDQAEDIALLTQAIPSLKAGEAELLLHSYAAGGHVGLLRALLEGKACSVDVRREKDGCTALHIAKYRQRADAAKLLLDFNADPDARNKFGETPNEAARAGKAASANTG